MRADLPLPGERSRRVLPGEGEVWLGIESASFIIIAGRDDYAAKCLDIAFGAEAVESRRIVRIF